jgi:capsular polysaccharide export protein
MLDYIPFGVKKIFFLKTIVLYLSLTQEIKKDIHLIKKKIFWGWGRKNSFKKAQQLALQYNGIAICAEDGFIRSLGLGKEGYQPLSFY